MSKKWILKDFAVVVVETCGKVKNAGEDSEKVIAEYNASMTRLMDLIDCHNDIKLLDMKRRYLASLIRKHWGDQRIPSVLTESVHQCIVYAATHDCSYKQAVKALYSNPDRITAFESFQISFDDFIKKFQKKDVLETEAVAVTA